MNEFISMGGYAGYVWPSFAVFFALLLADFLLPRWRRRRTLGEVRARVRRQQSKRGA